jgi:protein SCO1
MMPRWAPPALAAIGILLAGLGYFVIAQPVKVLPRLALAPGFGLVDGQGARVSSDDLRGSIVVFTFAPSRCGSDCEPLHRTMAGLSDQLDRIDTGGVPVRLVLVDLDGAHDRSELPNVPDSNIPDRWSVLTGDSATVRQVVGGGFEVFYERRADGTVRFDPAVVIVDGWGLTRVRHRIGVPPADVVADQLRLLGSEIRASTGVARFAYEAAHLFSCYAP